jgi:hypothetical protein
VAPGQQTDDLLVNGINLAAQVLQRRRRYPLGFRFRHNQMFPNLNRVCNIPFKNDQ